MRKIRFKPVCRHQFTIPKMNKIQDKSSKTNVNTADLEPEDGGGDFYAIQSSVIQLIEDYMRENPVNGKKMTIKAFAEKSGISVANLQGIISGYRWLARCNRDIIDKLAATLKIPSVQIYIMCGFITAKDFVLTENLDKTLDEVYKKMATSQDALFRVPGKARWDEWPADARLCLAMMYEVYIGKRLLKYATIEMPK